MKPRRVFAVGLLAAVGEFEAAYLAMLADASIFAADGDTLTLSNDSDTVLATFRRA